MTKWFGYTVFAFICVTLAGTALQARAETLDDASIRNFYAESAAAMHDPAKLGPFMDQRLDGNFTLQSNTTQILNGGSPQTNTSNNGKAATIANALRGINAMHIDTLDNKITSIKYSDDHKYAYVNDTTTSTGTFQIPGANATHYEDAESCVDRLSLESGIIMMMQSACNGRVVVTQ